MGRAATAKKLKAVETPTLKLDFGCGPHPRDGFEGVDAIAFDGSVKHVVDLRKTPWPWADSSVAEAHASHFVEHLNSDQRVAFCNELYRILAPGGSCFIVVPHWCSNRAYGDPTHQWPPVSEMWFYYLNKQWRMDNAPHTDVSRRKEGFSCNFDFTCGYNLRGDVPARNQETQQFWIQNYKEVAQDLIATIKAVK